MKRRSFLLFTVILLLFLAFLSARFRRQIQQDRTDLALMTAVQKESAKDVLLALREGANPDARESAVPPHGWRAVLRHFLHPSSPSLSNTILMVASGRGNSEIVRALVAAGARVNAVNGKGESALTLAVTEHRSDTICTLLAHGANPNAGTIEGDGSISPLLDEIVGTADDSMFERISRRTLVDRFLDKGADINASEADGDTALLMALTTFNAEIAIRLIQRGADVNRANRNGKTPLRASYKVSGDVTRLLLERGANVMPSRNGGWNLLCDAAGADDLPVARRAIKRGLGVNSRDKHGRTPLMYAAANGASQVFKLLLAEGADVNARDDRGWTALMFAAQGYSPYCVENLLLHGADCQLRDRDDHWTAEQRANHLGQEQVADLLRTGRSIRGQWASLSLLKDDRPYRSKPVTVDSYHRLETVRVPYKRPTNSSGDELPVDSVNVVVVQNDGKRGKPFGTRMMTGAPVIQVFHDADGLPCAFIKTGSWVEQDVIVAVQGRTLVQKCDCGNVLMLAFQPLPTGGALLTHFDRPEIKVALSNQAHPSHRPDIVAHVSRFRHGRLTTLGGIVFPQQEEQE